MIKLSNETKDSVAVNLMRAAIGTGVVLTVVGGAKLATASVAAYGTTKTVIGAAAIAGSAYGLYKLHQSELTVDMLIENVRNRTS